MALILGLGVAVVVATVGAVFYIRRAMHPGDPAGRRQQDPNMTRWRRPAEDDNWSIDDYRSPDPIRGRKAVPAGAPYRPNGNGYEPAGYGPGPGGPEGYGPGPDGYGSDGPGPDRYGPDGYGQAGYGPGPDGYGPGPDGYAPGPDGYGPDGYGSDGYGPDGYGPDGYGEGRGQRSQRRGRKRQQSAAGPRRFAGRGGSRGPQGPDEAGAAAFNPVSARKKKKGPARRLSVRLGRRDDDEMWPDDGVSDEEYWASVTDPGIVDPARMPRGRRGTPPGARPGEQRPGREPWQGGEGRNRGEPEPRQMPRPGFTRPTRALPAGSGGQGPGDMGGTGQRARPTGPRMRPGYGAPGNGADNGYGPPGNGTNGYRVPGNGANDGYGPPGNGANGYGMPGNGRQGNGTHGGYGMPGDGANDGYGQPANDMSGNGMSGNGANTASARPPAGPRDGGRQRGSYEPAPYPDAAQGPRGGGSRRPDVASDRYQAALTEQTQTFGIPPVEDDEESSQPRSGGGRHSRGSADYPTRSHPYPEPTGENPYDQGYGNGRR